MSDKDPIRAAQQNMRPAAPKRFYRLADVIERDGRWALSLDGRIAKTPGKNLLALPSRQLAARIAAEWARQGATIEPMSMPMTRLANSAIDGVAGAVSETRAEIASYAGSDLVCYRADAPDELVQRQAEAFDPVLAWAEEKLGARFVVGVGLIHFAQPEAALAAVRAALARFREPFALAALHALTTLSGSALIALRVAEGGMSAQEAWRAAHVDEDFQISKWGADDEAAARRAAREREFTAAAETLAALA
jgi:chaperone required for assembly of F1-ATPase